MIRKILAVLAMAVGALAFASVPAGATENEQKTYKVIVWEMPSWDGPQSPTWPQKIVSHAKQEVPSLNVSTPDCGYFQVDIYRYTDEDDIAKVNALVAGGVLNGPGNPPEPLISGGWGTAYKLVNAGRCKPEEPKPITGTDKGGDEPFCVEPADGNDSVTTWTQDWKQEPYFDKESWTWKFGEKVYDEKVYTTTTSPSEECPLPPKVVTTEWVDGDYECDDETVTQTRTVSTTPYVWGEGEWVAGETTVVTETQVRDLTVEEQTVCPTPTPTPTPTPSQQEELPHTGSVDPMLPLGGLALIGAGVTALLGSRRKGAHS